jgi:hypothetical protein
MGFDLNLADLRAMGFSRADLIALASAVGTVASVLVAVAALFVARRQSQEARKQSRQTWKHNRLSVRPHLSFRDQKEIKDDRLVHYELGLISTGIGPAVIRSFQVRVDDQVMTGQSAGWWAAMDKLSKSGIPLGAAQPRVYYLVEGEWAAPKEKFTLLVLTIKSEYNDELRARLMPSKTKAEFDTWISEGVEEQICRLAIEIEYESAYRGKQHYSCRFRPSSRPKR